MTQGSCLVIPLTAAEVRKCAELTELFAYVGFNCGKVCELNRVVHVPTVGHQLARPCYTYVRGKV